MELTLFLAGDVMLGRGIDQILKYKNDPELFESFIKDARYYIPETMKNFSEKEKYVGPDYVWGDLLSVRLFQISNLRIINLETSITISKDKQNKSVLYKMHPNNIDVLKVAGINYCHMANNHVMDWGVSGLRQTINTLTKNGIRFGGIGSNPKMAKMPTVFEINQQKIYIFSYGDVDSGIPISWKTNKHGVNVITTANNDTHVEIANEINQLAYDADFIIISIHWGSNWGYDIPAHHRRFAYYLIDNANVDLIHGHSSHHFRPVEIYHGKLILYGCGDLINDYEIIDNWERDAYLSWASIAYFPKYDMMTKKIVGLTLVPFKIKNMKLELSSYEEMAKITSRFNQICSIFRINFVLDDNVIKLNLKSGGGGYNYKYMKYKKKYLELLAL
jgi:poly-gamma-glutamate synthesis protein (capsule biosynthesis protein)